MALTSSLWPSKVLRGSVSPSLQTWIILSVLQVAKEVLFLQSTSSVGAVHAPKPVSHTTHFCFASALSALPQPRKYISWRF